MPDEHVMTSNLASSKFINSASPLINFNWVSFWAFLCAYMNEIHMTEIPEEKLLSSREVVLTLQ